MWYYSYSKYQNMTELPFYLVGIGQHELQPYMKKPEGHPRDQFFYSTEGSGCLRIQGKSVEIPAGSAFYIPAHVPHVYYPHGDVWDLRWVSCGGSGIGPLCELAGIRMGSVYKVKNAAALDALFNRMHMELVYDEECGNYFASAFLNEFILEFARQCSLLPVKTKEHVSENVYEKHMAVIRDYVEYHFMYSISMKDLCDLLLISPQHLCRIVKVCTGRRPTEYINMIRIEKAKRMLTETDAAVETVALWSGFENSNYFCKIFKRQAGMSPKQYRLQYASEHTIRRHSEERL